MSAVYITAWLSGFVLVGWLLVKWYESASAALDSTINEVLDAPREPAANAPPHDPRRQCPPCAEKGVCTCPPCVREVTTGQPQTGEAS